MGHPPKFMSTNDSCVLALAVWLIFPVLSCASAPTQATVQAAHGETVSRVEHTPWQEKAKDIAGALIPVAALAWAMWRFGINRGRFTFLDLDLSASALCANGDLLLVQVTVRLQNRGQTKIQARTREQLTGDKTFVHGEEADACKHAGTLKIRRVLESVTPTVFDWYSLSKISGVTILKDGNSAESDLEQLNYLNEYEDPEQSYNDVHYWLEPRESDNCRVVLWVPAGLYAIKAYFFGKRIDYKEQEYWSCTRVFNLRPAQGQGIRDSDSSPSKCSLDIKELFARIMGRR
jgi:hypothetical protein